MRNIYVDFDGVINSYQTPFNNDPGNLPDPPISGAFEWLKELTNNFRVTIYTTRMLQGESQAAICDWFMRNGMPFEIIDKLSFSCVKGGADVYIDDRAYRFEGTYPSIEELNNLKVWYK